MKYPFYEFMIHWVSSGIISAFGFYLIKTQYPDISWIAFAGGFLIVVGLQDNLEITKTLEEN